MIFRLLRGQCQWTSDRTLDWWGRRWRPQLWRWIGWYDFRRCGSAGVAHGVGSGRCGRTVRRSNNINVSGSAGGWLMKDVATIGRNQERTHLLHVIISREEVTAVDNFRFTRRMPNRASAIRELLRRGLRVSEKTSLDSSPCANGGEWGRYAPRRWAMAAL